MGVNGSYTTLLQQLLPPGRAWPRDPDAELTKLVDALAQELERVDARAVDLLDEADPRTAAEMLPEWEVALGLPDPTSPWPDADQNRAVHGRYAWRAGQDADYYRGLAASAGYASVEFSRYSTMKCTDPCTKALYDWHWLSAWLTTTEIGSNPALLEWAFRSNRQLHAEPLFAYTMIWTPRSSGVVSNLFAVAHDEHQSIAVGAEGVILGSSDGGAWSARSSGFAAGLNAVATSGGLWVAGGNGNRMLTSIDEGMSWTPHALPVAGFVCGIVRVPNGLWIAAASGGSVYTSPDTQTWTWRPTGVTDVLCAIAYGNGVVVAVGDGGAIVTSSDGGVTWTPRASGTTLSLRAIDYDLGTRVFIAAGENGVLVRSADEGATWTLGTRSTSDWLVALRHNGRGLWLAGRLDGHVSSSPDGDTWTERSTGSSLTVFGLTRTPGGRWIAVGRNGSILTSDN